MRKTINNTVNIIGAGLAGCECAYKLAENGVQVRLYEMKPEKRSPAHHSDGFAELVCSNSLKAKRTNSASGMLKREMETLGSLILEAATVSEVSAGGALAVDRDVFSEYITKKIQNHENITVISGEIKNLEMMENETIVIATGPLTSDDLSREIAILCGEESLSFYDAAAPIVLASSLDFDKVYFASRYDRGDADYINCPMNKDEYTAFIHELTKAKRAPLKDFEEDLKVFEGCMPVEVLASRGEDTLRFGPLRPVGLDDPRTGKWPYAVVQLRAENVEKTLYNIVGFQTNLTFAEQNRVFSMIAGLETAEFVRYGVMHRNTFIESPKVLARDNSLNNNRNIFFAGQITGTEGYVESAASGILVAMQIMRRAENKEEIRFPNDTMYGALHNYIFDQSPKDFQPMGANIGILPPLEEKIRGKQERYQIISDRGYSSFKQYLDSEEIKF